MGQTLTNADAALKEFYLPTIREQINQDVKILEWIEQNDTDIEGRRAVLSLHTTRNSGVGARGENETLPTAGNQGYTEQRVPLFYNYGRLEVTGPAIRAMKSDKGSFTRVVESESRGVVNDSKRDVNRQAWGTSNGVIATCGTTSTSTTLVLAAATTAVQMRQFHRTMSVDVGTLAEIEAGTAQTRTISSIDASASPPTLTVSATVVTDGSDFVAVASASGTTQREITGLQSIVTNSGTLFNVNPTTDIEWKSTVLANSGTNRAPTDDLFEQLCDEVYLEGGEMIDAVFVSHGVRRSYANQLKAQKRFSNTIQLKGGFSGVSFSTPDGGEIGLVAERDVPDNKAYGLNSSHLIHFVESDWEFMDDDGAVLSRVSNKDAYEASLFKYHEQATDKRNAHGRIDDLTNS